jgi:peptidoglycan/xylan/chitin deacetylase (PgdA/CDA1 family)
LSIINVLITDVLRCTPVSDDSCLYDAEKAKYFLSGRTPNVYLTFDDGPGHGTKAVLDALKANNIKATFFIYAESFTPKWAREERKNLLKRIHEEGHDLGDHSSNHMKHNSNGSPYGAYTNVKVDAGYFGPANTGEVAKAFLEFGYDAAKSEEIASRMGKMARMPYTNNWRVTLPDGSIINRNCVHCTAPKESGQIGVKVADMLAAQGVSVYGWDEEWKPDWSLNRLAGSVNARTMLADLHDGTLTAMPGKIIVLSHDAHFNAANEGDLQYGEMLSEFIKMAKEAGYQFRTMSQYPADE